MKKKFWNSDKIVSIAAISISMLTLYIFMRQTNIIDEQSHLSVMPYLMMDSANNSEKMTFAIDIVNYGVGPAIVESRVMEYDGKTYDLEFYDFLKQVIPDMDSIDVLNHTTLQVGVAVPAGSKRNIITAGGNQKDYLKFLEIMQNLNENGFNYEIKYKSIYTDRWKITAKENTPIEIDN